MRKNKWYLIGVVIAAILITYIAKNTDSISVMLSNGIVNGINAIFNALVDFMMGR